MENFENWNNARRRIHAGKKICFFLQFCNGFLQSILGLDQWLHHKNINIFQNQNPERKYWIEFAKGMLQKSNNYLSSVRVTFQLKPRWNMAAKAKGCGWFTNIFDDIERKGLQYLIGPKHLANDYLKNTLKRSCEARSY